MVAAYRDPVMWRWLRHPVTTDDQARQLIAARTQDTLAGKSFSFAILERTADGEAGDLAGGISLRGLGDGTVTGEVGYWVAAAARGRGVAPRALNALCDWAFGMPRTPRLERLELIHSVGNHASCRVAEKTGFPLAAILDPLPPDFPDHGHLHVRLASASSR